MRSNLNRRSWSLDCLPRIAGGAPDTLEQLAALLGAELSTFTTPESLTAALAALTDEALAQAGVLLAEAYADASAVEEGARRTIEQVDVMEGIAAAILAARADTERRETEAEAVEARAAAIDATVNTPPVVAEGDPADEPAGDGTEATPPVEDAPPVEGDPVTPPVEDITPPVALPEAAAAQPASLARAARQTPRPVRPASTPTPMARNLVGGRDFTSPEQIVEAMTAAVNDGLGGYAAATQRTRVARFAARPSEFAVGDGDNASVAGRVIDQAVRAHQASRGQALSLVAAGGVCAPATPLYDIPQIADTTSRPIRDSLARIAMPRGRVTYPIPRSIADVRDAITVWTLANDLAALTDPEVRKDCARVECPDFLTAQIQAIVRCFTFGNLNARAFAEDVANALELGAGAQAEAAEGELLTAMAAASMDVFTASTYGAGRDWLFYLEMAAEEGRDRFRMPTDARVEIWAPRWTRGILRGDIARQMPGDGLDALSVSNGQLDSWLAQRNIFPTWYLDGEHFAAQTDGAIISPYPFQVDVIMAHPGAHAFGDDGVLDLGVQRSPELNESNDFQVFAETIEGHAFRGLWSKNLHMDLCPNGTAAALSTPEACAS